MVKDFRKIKAYHDYENAQIPSGYSVADLLPQIRRVLRMKNFYGPLSLNVVVSDASNQRKIPRKVVDDLVRHKEIDFTDCEIPNQPQVSDECISRKALRWVDETDCGLIVLIGGDGGYARLFDRIEDKKKDILIFLIWPKDRTSNEMKEYPVHERFMWEDVFTLPLDGDERRGDDEGGDKDKDGGGDKDKDGGGDKDKDGGEKKRKRIEDSRFLGGASKLLKEALTDVKKDGEKRKSRVFEAVFTRIAPLDAEEDFCSETSGYALWACAVCNKLAGRDVDNFIPKWFPDVEVVESSLEKATSMVSEEATKYLF